MRTSEGYKVSPAVFRSKAKRFQRPVLIRALYKSELEDSVAQQLEAAAVPFTYEKDKLKYEVPARTATYTPDFKIGSMLIETKGWFKAEDRKKLKLVKASHPDLDIRVVFDKRATKTKIAKGSPTTYAKWCDDHWFPWADNGVIPKAWLDEVTHHKTESISSE